MNRKIILFAMIIAGVLLNSRFTYAKGVNCEDPKLASDECIVNFETPLVKRSIVILLVEYGFIDGKYADNPDSYGDITVGQMRSLPERIHLNILPDPDETKTVIKEALNGGRTSLKGLEYLKAAYGFYSRLQSIYDYSSLSNVKISVSTEWYDSNLVLLRDVKLNEYGVFKNPVIGIDGNPLPFGDFPEEQIKELAKKGREPILVQDVNERGEPDINGGYLKLLNKPYILDYETVIEDADNDYAYLENYQYGGGMILLGVSIAKEEPQAIEDKKNDHSSKQNIEVPNTGFSGSKEVIWLMSYMILSITTFYTFKKR